MFTQIHYMIRSKTDGSYIAARPHGGSPETEPGYLLMFRERFDALSYLNTHGSGVADRFTVESVSGNQLKGILQRWGFTGIALVRDPLVPQIEFLTYESGY